MKECKLSISQNSLACIILSLKVSLLGLRILIFFFSIFAKVFCLLREENQMPLSFTCLIKECKLSISQNSLACFILSLKVTLLGLTILIFFFSIFAKVFCLLREENQMSFSFTCLIKECKLSISQNSLACIILSLKVSLLGLRILIFFFSIFAKVFCLMREENQMPFSFTCLIKECKLSISQNSLACFILFYLLPNKFSLGIKLLKSKIQRKGSTLIETQISYI